MCVTRQVAGLPYESVMARLMGPAGTCVRLGLLRGHSPLTMPVEVRALNALAALQLLRRAFCACCVALIALRLIAPRPSQCRSRCARSTRLLRCDVVAPRFLRLLRCAYCAALDCASPLTMPVEVRALNALAALRCCCAALFAPVALRLLRCA